MKNQANFFYKLIYFSLIVSSLPMTTQATNVIDFSGYPASIKVIAETTPGTMVKGNFIDNGAQVTFVGVNDMYNDYAFYDYVAIDIMPTCETNPPTLDWFLAQAQKYPIFKFRRVTQSAGAGNQYGKKWKFLTATTYTTSSPRCGGGLTYACRTTTGDTWYKRVAICPFGDGAIDPPIEDPDSVCSLNSQNLNLNYSSTSLNVNGLKQSTNLTVSCTSGKAQNYTLKLTGSNVVNGRLNFGNGVSATVTLNGLSVIANGNGIQLNNLVNQNIPVSATLVGSANSSGASSANGILILEAL